MPGRDLFLFVRFTAGLPTYDQFYTLFRVLWVLDHAVSMISNGKTQESRGLTRCYSGAF